MGDMGAWLSVLPATVTYLGVVCAGLALILLLMTLWALRNRRPFRALVRLVFAAAFAAIALAVAVTAAGMRTYHTLSEEQTAAVVSVEPTGPQRFVAQFVFPDGHKKTYAIAGDQLYVDARIIKWKYWANLLGLRTAYELDRVGGRYASVEDERTKTRTVETVAAPATVDLFALRKQYQFLIPVYDADYGSATFVPANEPAMYEIQVSSTGLLARPVQVASEPLSH